MFLRRRRNDPLGLAHSVQLLLVSAVLFFVYSSRFNDVDERWPQRGDEPRLHVKVDGDGSMRRVLERLFEATCADDTTATRDLLKRHRVDANAYLFSTGSAFAGDYAATLPRGQGGERAYTATILHVAASCGASRVAELLTKRMQADVRARDAFEHAPRQVVGALTAQTGNGKSKSKSKSKSEGTGTGKGKGSIMDDRELLDLLDVPCADLYSLWPAHDTAEARARQPPCRDPGPGLTRG